MELGQAEYRRGMRSRQARAFDSERYCSAQRARQA